MNKDQVKAICECVDNVLSGNIPIDSTTIKKLRRRRKALTAIRNKNIPLAEKKQLINQTGGFLPALLVPVLATAASFLGDIIGRAL